MTGRWSHLDDATLKRHIDRVVGELTGASAERRLDLLDEIAEVRDEMIERLRWRGGGGDQLGVREPRRPSPGGDSAAAALESDEQDR